MDPKLKEYLEKNDISYEFHSHPPVFTVAESRKIKTNFTGFHTKSLFLKDSSGEFHLVCAPGDKRLNIKFLRQHLNVKKLHFASPDELKSQLNITPGSVSIFCIINSNQEKIHLIIDKEVWDAQTSGFHPNDNTATLELHHKDLEKFYNSLKAKKEILEISAG